MGRVQLDRKTLLRLRSDIKKTREWTLELMRKAVTRSTSEAYRYRAIGLLDALACVECRLEGSPPKLNPLVKGRLK